MLLLSPAAHPRPNSERTNIHIARRSAAIIGSSMADKPPPSPAPYNFRHQRDPARATPSNSASTQRRPRTSSARTSAARGDTNLTQWRKPLLQEECNRRGLPTDGTKEQLIARLQQDMHPAGAPPPPATPTRRPPANPTAATPLRRSRRHTAANDSETSAPATPVVRASRRRRNTEASESAAETPPRRGRRRAADADESAGEPTVDETPITRSRRGRKNDESKKPPRRHATNAGETAAAEQPVDETPMTRSRRAGKPDAPEPETPSTRPRTRRSAAPSRTPATRTLPRRAAAASRRTPPGEAVGQETPPADTARRLSMEPPTPSQPWRLGDPLPPADESLPPAMLPSPATSRRTRAAKRSSATYTNADGEGDAGADVTPASVGGHSSAAVPTAFPALPAADADKASPSTRRVVAAPAETEVEAAETSDKPNEKGQDESMGGKLTSEALVEETPDMDVEMSAADGPDVSESVEVAVGSEKPESEDIPEIDPETPNVNVGKPAADDHMQDESMDAAVGREKPEVSADVPDMDDEKPATDGQDLEKMEAVPDNEKPVIEDISDADAAKLGINVDGRNLGETTEAAPSSEKQAVEDEKPQTVDTDLAESMDVAPGSEKPEIDDVPEVDDKEPGVRSRAAAPDPLQRTSFMLMPDTSSGEEDDKENLSSQALLPLSLATPLTKGDGPSQADSAADTPMYMNFAVTYAETPGNERSRKEFVSHTPSSTANILSRLCTPAKGRSLRLSTARKSGGDELSASKPAPEPEAEPVEKSGDDVDMRDRSAESPETGKLSVQPASETKEFVPADDHTAADLDDDEEAPGADEAKPVEDAEGVKPVEPAAPEQMRELPTDARAASASSDEVEQVDSSEDSACSDDNQREAVRAADKPARRGKSPILPARVLATAADTNDESNDDDVEEVTDGSDAQAILSGGSVEDVDMDEVQQIDGDSDPGDAENLHENASRTRRKDSPIEVMALDDDERDNDADGAESLDEDAEFSSLEEQVPAARGPAAAVDVDGGERFVEVSRAAESSEGGGERNQVHDVEEDEVVAVRDDNADKSGPKEDSISSLDSPNEENIERHFGADDRGEEDGGVEDDEVEEVDGADDRRASPDGGSLSVYEDEVSLTGSEGRPAKAAESNGTGSAAVAGHRQSEAHDAADEDSVPDVDIVAAVESDGVEEDAINPGPLENAIGDVPQEDGSNVADSKLDTAPGRKRRRDDEDDDDEIMADTELIDSDSDQKPAPVPRKKQRMQDVVTQLHRSMPTPDSTIAEIIRDSSMGVDSHKREETVDDPALQSPGQKQRLGFLERLKEIEGASSSAALFKADGPAASAFALPVAFNMGTAYKPPRPSARVGKSRFRPLNTKAVRPRRIQARGLWDSARLADHSSRRAAELSAEVQAWRRVPEAVGDAAGEGWKRQRTSPVQEAAPVRRY